MEGLHVAELTDAILVAPCRKAAGRVQVRLAGVVAVDLGGEEFEHSLGCLGCLGCRGEKRGGLNLPARGEDDFGDRRDASTAELMNA